MRVLIIGSTDDIPRSYGWYYLRQLARIAEEKGHEVNLMRSPLLYQFEKELKSFDPELVIINGHGGDRAIVVNDTHAVLGVPGYSPELNLKIARGNPELMRGRDVYLFTCNAGKILAPALMQYGAKSVVAYDDAFLWSTDDLAPTADKLAEPNFKAALHYPILLFSGINKQEAFQRTKEKFNQYLKKAIDEDQEKYLYHDYLHLKKWGFGG